MINIGNKEITSIYCGKNAVNGIYCGQTLIWPTTPPTKKHYLISFYSQYPNASYDIENPDGGTDDNEFFQEVYESTSDDKIYIAKVVKEYDPDSYEIIKWEYSAFSRHIADDEIKVVVPVIAYDEMEDVGDCWFRSEIYRTFDNQADADEYVNYVHQNGIDDFTDFEMSSAKDIVYNGTQPYTEFPYTRSVWPPSDPSVDTQNWISEVYYELPKYNEHEVYKNEWLYGIITDESGYSKQTIFKKRQRNDTGIYFNIYKIDGEIVDDDLITIGWDNRNNRWNLALVRDGQTDNYNFSNITDINTQQFNGNIYYQGINILETRLTRTNWNPEVPRQEWLIGTITDSQGEEFDAVFTKPLDDYDYIEFDLASLNGQPADYDSPLFFELFKSGISNWSFNMYMNGKYFGNQQLDISYKEAKQFNFTFVKGGMTIQINLIRTSFDPTI